MSNDNGEKLSGAKEGIVEQQERLKYIETRIKELEPLKETPEARKELSALYDEKIKLTIKSEQVVQEVPKEAPKDFKIAEIWVREGQLILDASPEFWIDKLRALGVLEMCKDIVKKYEHAQPKVSLVNKNGIKNFVNKLKKRF